MAGEKHFFGRLLGTRSTWPMDMSESEQEIMAQHFAYLSRLVDEGQVLIAGPCFSSPPFGLVVIHASSEEAAAEMLRQDPSVREGLHTFDLVEMKLSLFAGDSAPS